MLTRAPLHPARTLGLLSLVACGTTGEETSTSGDTPGGTPDLTCFTEVTAGLEACDLVVGTGNEAVDDGSVTVHYTGWLYEGGIRTTQIDSSEGKDPLSTSLAPGNVIDGWELGIPGMRVGGVRHLIIGPDLAYGADGRGPVPPNATLYFDIELISVP